MTIDSTDIFEFKNNYSFPLYIQKVWIEMFAHLKNQKNINYLEVGSDERRSLLWVWQNILPQDSCRIEAIDYFGDEDSKKRFLKNTKKLLENGILSLIIGDSQKKLKTCPKSNYDLIYIDGGHSYQNVWNDAVLSWPSLKVGGFLVFDDYLWMKYELPPDQRPGPAIDDFLVKSEGCHQLLFKNVQVFLQKKTELPSHILPIEETSEQIPRAGHLLPKPVSYFLKQLEYYLYSRQRPVR